MRSRWSLRAVVSGTVACGCAAALGFAPAAQAGLMTPPAGTFLQVSVGNSRACAVRTDHTLACWGFPPVVVPPAGAFTQVGAPADGPFACAIRTDQTLVCFGTSGIPGLDAINPPAGTFSALSMTMLNGCALRTDQTVACWGFNAGLFPPPAGTFTALDVDDSGGGACALRSDHTAVCWGSNIAGTFSPANTFTAIGAGTVSFGSALVCGVGSTDGALACLSPNSAPPFGAQIPAGAYTAVDGGNNYACAIRVDQAVVCWGRNDFGQTLPPAGAFTSVSAGELSACAIRTDQTLACWGELTGPDTPTAPAAAATQAPNAPMPAPTAPSRLPRLPAAFGANGVFSLPSNRACVSRRSFRIRIRRQRAGVTLVSAAVAVNNRRVAVRKGARLTAPVDLRGLPKGRFTVRISALTADGRAIVGARRYRTCAPKPASGGHGPLGLLVLDARRREAVGPEPDRRSPGPRAGAS